MYTIDLIKRVSFYEDAATDYYIIDITSTNFGKLLILRDILKREYNEFTFIEMKIGYISDGANLKRYNKGFVNLDILKTSRYLEFPNTVEVAFFIRPDIPNSYAFRERVIRLLCSWSLSENMYLLKSGHKVSEGNIKSYKCSLCAISCNDTDMTLGFYPIWELDYE